MVLHVQPVSALITPFSAELPGRFPCLLLGILILAVVRKSYGAARLSERRFLFQLVLHLFCGQPAS